MWAFLLLSTASSQSCPRYNCHEGGFSISPTCGALTSSGNILLQICDNSTQPYCEVSGTITNNYTCTSGPTFPSFFEYPGEYCRQNSDCITNVCESNQCVGQSPGGSCVSNSDCDVGLYCGDAFFCTPQLPYGQPCSNDYQCQNNLACNRTLFQDGTCVYYYSIPNGGIVGLCQDMVIEGYSNLCQSGACTLTNIGFDSVGICQPAYYNLFSYPKVCESDSDCIGYNGAKSINGSCSCGMDQNGQAYCDAFSQDPPAFTVQLLWELHVNSSGINDCHTQRRFDIFCLRQNLGPTQVQNFLNNRELCTDTARYQNNDYCTKAIFNHQFFNVGPTNYACQAYGCANLQGWTQNTCITYVEQNNTYAINPCSASSGTPFCDTTIAAANKWSNVTCAKNPGLPVGYAGDPCTNFTQCISGICTGGVCQGVGLGGFCSGSQSCNVGLYCASKNYQFSCQPLIQAYNFGCGSDYDCVNYCGCNFGASGPPGMCVPYFSLASNASVPCGRSGISYLCSTGACYGTRNSITGTCTAAPKSVSALPTQCNFNGQCMGKNSYGQTFQGTCTCGYNNNATSYCSVFSGDQPGSTYFKTLKKFLNSTSSINSCQTTRRFSQDCFNIVATAMGIKNSTWYVQMLNFTMYPYFIGNDACVKTVYTSQFWNNLGEVQNGLEMREEPGLRLESS